MSDIPIGAYIEDIDDDPRFHGRILRIQGIGVSGYFGPVVHKIHPTDGNSGWLPFRQARQLSTSEELRLALEGERT